MKSHPTYGVQIMETPDGKWYWDEEYRMVDFVPRGKSRATASFRMRKENTLRNALRMVCHRMLGATTGNQEGDHR